MWHTWRFLVLQAVCADVRPHRMNSAATVIMAADSRGSLMMRHEEFATHLDTQDSVPDKHRTPSAQAVADAQSIELPLVVARPQGHGTLANSICVLAVILVCSATLRLMIRQPSEEPLDLLSAILLCGAYVAIAATSDILVKWEAQAHGGILPFAPARMVFVVEILKLCLTLPLVLVRYANNSFRWPPKAESLVALRLMCIPAISYSMNNAIIFFVVAHVDFSSLSVWRQLTPLFVAFIWVLVFGRSIGRQRWFALALLVVGTILNSFSQGGGIRFNVIVFVVLGSCLSTAIAGVANEYVLKRCGALDIDFLCVLLYIQTSVFSLFLAAACESESLMMNLAGSPAKVVSPGTLLGGPPLLEDARPLVIVGLQVLFGFAVARVIRYLGSVPRAIVNAVKELTVVVVAPAFIDSRLNGAIVISAAIVGGAAALFTLAPSPLPTETAVGTVTIHCKRVPETVLTGG